MVNNPLVLAAALLLGTLTLGQGPNLQGKPSKTPQQKIKVPDIGSRRTITAEVREIFKEDYARTDSASRKALGVKLLKQASATKADHVSRFVLLLEAQEVATGAGDARTAFKAIEAIFSKYIGMWVTRSRMEMDVLEQSRALAKTRAAKKEVAGLFLQTAQRAAKEKNFFTALKASQTVEAIAREIKDESLLSTAVSLSKTIPKARSEFDLARRAMATLSRNPTDREANLAMGRFLCFTKGDWKSGLPYLIKGAQGELLQVAKSELTPPKTPTEQLARGDAWAALIPKEEDSQAGDYYARRAHAWYEKALAGAEGFVRLRVAKRLEKLPLPKGPIDLLALIDVKRDSYKGGWTLQDDLLVSTENISAIQIPYEPPGEYDLTFVVERKGKAFLAIGLIKDGLHFHVTMDFNGLSGLHGVNETLKRTGPVFPPNTPITVVCTIRKSHVAIALNGQTVIRWKGHLSRLSTRVPLLPPNRNALSLSTWDTTFHFHSIQIVNHSKYRKVALDVPTRPKGPSGLVGRWDFDEGHGTRIQDSSGKANHGKLAGLAGWTRGRFGTALIFSPSLGTYINTQGKPLPATNAPQTISWWFFYPSKPKTPASDPASKQMMISIMKKGQIGGLRTGFFWSKLAIWKGKGTPLLTTSIPSAGVWHHCAYTSDGRTHKIYVDGQSKASSRVPPDAIQPDRLTFGRWADGGWHFTGDLDEIRIYNRALTASEIKALAEGAD